MAADITRPKGGVFWSTVNGGASVILPFLVFAAFTRMMPPPELAQVMLAIAMLELLKTCGPQGIYDVLLVYSEGQHQYYRTAAALFIGAGVLIALAFSIGVFLSASLLRTALPCSLHLLALKIVFDFALFQPQAILVRRGAMQRLGSRGLTAGLLAGAGGLALAAMTEPLLGLVAYYVLQSFVTLLLTVAGTRALVRPQWNRQAAREMAGQGARASGVRLAAGASNYLDQLLIGTMLVGAQTGMYNLGKRLEIVSMTIGSSFSQLLFQPTFAKANHEDRFLYIARGIAAISLVCGVPTILLAIFHRQAVPLVFGQQWSAASLTVALLAGSGFVRAVGGVAGALFTVTSRNGRLLALSVFAAATNMLMIVVFAPLGVEWAAGAILVRNSLQAVGGLALTHEAKGNVARLLTKNCVLPLAATGAAAWIAATSVHLLWPAASPLAGLSAMVIGSAAGTAIGFLFLRRRL